jgi:hypothetical protein
LPHEENPAFVDDLAVRSGDDVLRLFLDLRKEVRAGLQDGLLFAGPGEVRNQSLAARVGAVVFRRNYFFPIMPVFRA